MGQGHHVTGAFGKKLLKAVSEPAQATGRGSSDCNADAHQEILSFVMIPYSLRSRPETFARYGSFFLVCDLGYLEMTF